ncbi:MAG: polyphosphate polymerase domain-containing protein [Planctomycetales bacterium]|nr:polyphosphate polymerase domain-containing protein [Planctomycetales bacterium]
MAIRVMTVKKANDGLVEARLSSSSVDAVRRRPAGIVATDAILPKTPPAAPIAQLHMPQSPDTTLLCRYELKYRIPEVKARALAEYVRAYIHPDRHAKNRPGHQYPISSLYLDSTALALCNETLQGKKNRFKLRIRGYDDNPQSPVFLEVKRRINTVIMKNRVAVPRESIGEILSSRYTPPLAYAKDQEAFQQFMLYTVSLHAQPVVMVRYMRQAYEGDSNNRVRVTFDRQLSFKITRQPMVCLNGAGWNSVAIDFVILEIKFTARYPAWLSDMVKIFDLKQTTMSKYCSSIKQSCQLAFCAPNMEQMIWCYDE